MTKYVTLVGSREAPQSVCKVAERIGKFLSDRGFIGRSGRAIGMDSAFERFYDPDLFEAYVIKNLPNAINVRHHDMAAYEELAASLIPHYEYLDFYSRWLHARNTCQVLGLDLKTPSMLLVCWAPEPRKGGGVRGGTKSAVALARRHGIPVSNLYHRDQLIKWCEKVGCEVPADPNHVSQQDLSFLDK